MKNLIDFDTHDEYYDIQQRYSDAKNNEQQISNKTAIEQTKFGCLTLIQNDIKYIIDVIHQIELKKQEAIVKASKIKNNICIDKHRYFYNDILDTTQNYNQYTEFIEYYKNGKIIDYIEMYYYIETQDKIRHFNEDIQERFCVLQCTCSNTVIKNIRYLSENKRPRYCSEYCKRRTATQFAKNYKEFIKYDRSGRYFGTLYIQSKTDEKENNHIIKRTYKCKCHCCNQEYEFDAIDFYTSEKDIVPVAKCNTCCNDYMISKSEWKVITELDRLGINYISQYKIDVTQDYIEKLNGLRYLHADIALFDKYNNITHIIEVNGPHHYIPQSCNFGCPSSECIDRELRSLHLTQKRDLYIKTLCLYNNIEYIELANMQYDKLSDILRCFGISIINDEHN